MALIKRVETVAQDPFLDQSPQRGDQHSDSVPPRSLLEDSFPAALVSRLAKAGRGRPDAAYGAHKWWARRPPESVRALLIASVLDSSESDAFWSSYEDRESSLLSDRAVADPFVGGGTSLVEAQRLGAAVYGQDVDPLAALLTSHELAPLDIEQFESAADRLLAHLAPIVEERFAPTTTGEMPLHYFFVRRVACPRCKATGLMFKNRVLARDLGRVGAVVRGGKMAAFCTCGEVHNVPAKTRRITCNGRYVSLYRGSYADGRYSCASCGERSSHQSLETALSERVLVGVEVTQISGPRSIRSPTPEERSQEASDRLALDSAMKNLVLPSRPLAGDLLAHKPGIYGFRSFRSLFSARQLLVFGTAFAWLNNERLDGRIKEALALGISNALSTNNLLCSYATDYGRLAPLFSVRDYSMPILSVELNPLHTSGGRGTLRATLRRVAASKAAIPEPTAAASIQVADSSQADWPDAVGFDVVMTDPPYFDYIAYSDLSDFFRCWLEVVNISMPAFSGAPLYSGGESKETFAERLGESLKRVCNRMNSGGLAVFTYHATTRPGWDAIVSAVKLAGLTVTAAFPLWADAKSPGHGHAGNVEYDIVFCCRPADLAARVEVSVDAWKAMFADNSIGPPDLAAWLLACDAINSLPPKPSRHL